MQRPRIVQQIAALMKQVAPTAQTILYGSEARGDARLDSDIDLLVLVDTPKLKPEQEEPIIRPLLVLEVETGVAINVHVESKERWSNRPFQTPFMLNVVNEGIVLWRGIV